MDSRGGGRGGLSQSRDDFATTLSLQTVSLAKKLLTTSGLPVFLSFSQLVSAVNICLARNVLFKFVW